MSTVRQPLTVRALIQQLSALPEEQQDVVVGLQGCDCNGNCYGLRLDDEYSDDEDNIVPRVLLLRYDSGARDGIKIDPDDDDE